MSRKAVSGSPGKAIQQVFGTRVSIVHVPSQPFGQVDAAALVAGDERNRLLAEMGWTLMTSFEKDLFFALKVINGGLVHGM